MTSTRHVWNTGGTWRTQRKPLKHIQTPTHRVEVGTEPEAHPPTHTHTFLIKHRETVLLGFTFISRTRLCQIRIWESLSRFQPYPCDQYQLRGIYFTLYHRNCLCHRYHQEVNARLIPVLIATLIMRYRVFSLFGSDELHCFTLPVFKLTSTESNKKQVTSCRDQFSADVPVWSRGTRLLLLTNRQSCYLYSKYIHRVANVDVA